MIVIKAEKSINDVNNVIEIVEKTQYDIFNNEFEYDKDISLSDTVYCKGVKKVVNINRQLALALEDETMFRELTPFDRAVHNAVCSLCHSGIESFTTEQVYRVLVGDAEAHFDNKNNKSKEIIEESLKTLRNRIVGIDFEEEGKYFGISLLTENGNEITEVSNYILPLSHVTLLMKNGKKVEAWNLLSEPPLLSYARIKRQIETIAMEQLNVPLKLTQENIKLREFLLTRIMLIKSKTLRNGKMKKHFENCNIIRFETIYELFNIDEKDHSSKAINQRRRLRERCEKMLEFWVNETKMLSNFSSIKEGNIIGYKLVINLDKFKLQAEDIWYKSEETEEIETIAK